MKMIEQKIEEKERAEESTKKNRWVLASERFDSEGFLDGEGEKVKKLIHDFRKSFTL
jgi:hypothetical protein